MTTTPHSPRQLALRWLVQLAATIGLFVTGLAWLGTADALGSGPGFAVVVSAAIAFALPALVARAPGEIEAVASNVAWFLGAGVLLVLLSGRTSPASGASGAAAVVRWIVSGLFHAAAFMPAALLLHRGATVDARDAADRALLAASACLTASLAESTFVMRSARAAGFSYVGWTAPLLGPALVTLLALAGLTAAGVIVRGVRWLALWRRVRRGSGWRLVRAAAWERAVPEVAWFALRGAELDAVVVRRVASEGGAYRDAALEAAVARVPGKADRVTRMLARRVAVAGALVVVLALLATGPLASLRW
ncbi:MAG: hypothetical protein EPO40_21650 [Myxococcaceae bacterium]|nr:MAG: hypothetical protein EPO40_21650 [Myxococcaceae bacterium]